MACSWPTPQSRHSAWMNRGTRLELVKATRPQQETARNHRECLPRWWAPGLCNAWVYCVHANGQKLHRNWGTATVPPGLRRPRAPMRWSACLLTDLLERTLTWVPSPFIFVYAYPPASSQTPAWISSGSGLCLHLLSIASLPFRITAHCLRPPYTRRLIYQANRPLNN